MKSLNDLNNNDNNDNIIRRKNAIIEWKITDKKIWNQNGKKKWTYWQDSILSFHERRRTHTNIIIMNRQSFEREEMKKKSAWNLKNSIKVMSNQQTSQPTRRLWEIYYSYKWIVWLNGLRWNRQTKKTKKKKYKRIQSNRIES